MAKKRTILNGEQIEQMQVLFQIGIPKTIIAKHFNVTPPTVTYYTAGFPIMPVHQVIQLLGDCNVHAESLKEITRNTTDTIEQQA